MGKKISIAVVVAALATAWLLFGSQKQPTSTAEAGQQGGTQYAVEEGVEGPKIAFPEDTFDFGDITQNASVTHIFKVHNVGNAPLELIKAAAS